MLIRDRRTGESKRFGFIYFKEIESAAKAREALNGTVRPRTQSVALFALIVLHLVDSPRLEGPHRL